MEDRYAEQYRALHDRHWWWRSREAWVLGWVARLDRARKLGRILDVGCGDGLLFDRLARFGRVEGLEPDARLIRDPRWRDAIRPVPLGPGAVPSSSYDLVLMLDVLEHIEDDRAALRQAGEALRPGGSLLLTVPALARLWSRHDEANHHVRRYQRPDLRAALESAGLRVETLRYFFAWTVLPLLARRWLAPAGRAGPGDYEVGIPPGPVNRALATLSRAEHLLSAQIAWPVGGSLLAIARKA